MTKIAPQTTDQAAAFLREAHEGPLEWKALCLKLQRMARGLPAVYPSALAAMEATPVGERVTKLEDLRRGMVAYSDDPNDSNPFAHIYFIAGRSKSGDILTWTNDALRTGGVDVVPITFYLDRWGDSFKFGASWLNGYDFSDANGKPKNTRGSLGENYSHAIEDVRKSIRYHRDAGHVKLVALLERDLEVMKKRKARFS